MYGTLFSIALLFSSIVPSHAGLGCPEKFTDVGGPFCAFTGKTPGYTITQLTWTCSHIGGTLPTFADTTEADGFNALMASTPLLNVPVPMGYFNSQPHSPSNHGIWYDHKSLSCSPMPWPSGQPDNVGGQEGCMQMTVGRPSYTLSDANCSTVFIDVVCVWRPNALTACLPHADESVQPKGIAAKASVSVGKSGCTAAATDCKQIIR